MQPTALRNTCFVTCLVLTTFCLAAGYALCGQWVGVGIAVVTGPAWLLARKNTDSLPAHICLLAAVCLAVIGRLVGASPILMLIGSGAGLATWDLILLNTALKSSDFGEQTRRYQNRRLQALVLGVGCGLLVAILGRWLDLQMPFALLVICVILVLLGMDRIGRYIKKVG